MVFQKNIHFQSCVEAVFAFYATIDQHACADTETLRIEVPVSFVFLRTPYCGGDSRRLYYASSAEIHIAQPAAQRHASTQRTASNERKDRVESGFDGKNRLFMQEKGLHLSKLRNIRRNQWILGLWSLRHSPQARRRAALVA